MRRLTTLLLVSIVVALPLGGAASPRTVEDTYTAGRLNWCGAEIIGDGIQWMGTTLWDIFFVVVDDVKVRLFGGERDAQPAPEFLPVRPDRQLAEDATCFDLLPEERAVTVRVHDEGATEVTFWYGFTGHGNENQSEQSLLASGRICGNEAALAIPPGATKLAITVYPSSECTGLLRVTGTKGTVVATFT